MWTMPLWSLTSAVTSLCRNFIVVATSVFCLEVKSCQVSDNLPNTANRVVLRGTLTQETFYDLRSNADLLSKGQLTAQR